jgi:hypothetical protein
MARASTHPFDSLLDLAANMLVERLAPIVAAGLSMPAAGTRAPGGLSANEKRRRAMLGRKLDMSCRIPGCKNRSGGPGQGYICKEHQKLPKKQQEAARAAWKAKRAA